MGRSMKGGGGQHGTVVTPWHGGGPRHGFIRDEDGERGYVSLYCSHRRILQILTLTQQSFRRSDGT